MSFRLVLEEKQPSSRRLTSANAEASRSVINDHRHEQDKAELQRVIKRQAERIAKLKVDSAVQLEHHATLRRLDLERRREEVQNAIAALQPRLQAVRGQWAQAREFNHGYELQWGTMRTQYQQIKGRVDAMRDQVDDTKANTDTLRKVIAEMREHLHRLNRDKMTLRQKVKRSLECLVIDDSIIKSRMQEEEVYLNQMVQAHKAIRMEYNEAQVQNQSELAPLAEDVKVLNQYLEEMQSRTKELQKYCIDLEAKVQVVEEKWISDVHNVFGSLERANQRDTIKGVVLSALEQQISEFQRNNVAQRNNYGHGDLLWLTNNLAVWENVINAQISQQRQKMQMREDGVQLLAQTSQACIAAKQELAQLRQEINGDSVVRRVTLNDIVDLHYLIHEKKLNEEQMINYVQEVCTQLDENLPHVLQYIRREGFEDYVSSTDEDREDEVEGFAPLQEESSDSVAQIVSSIDLDADDPSNQERMRQMSHRPVGPLLEFAARKAKFLQDGGGPTRVGSTKRTREAQLQETLDRAVMHVQQRVTDEVVAFIRNRQQQIQQGLLDPKNERLNADPKYASYVRDVNARIERFIQQQKENPGKALQILSRGPIPASPGGAAAASANSGGPAAQPRIIIEGARVPVEVARGNPVVKTNFFVTNCVRGVSLMMIPRRAMEPQLRHIYLSRDLSKFVARRVGGDRLDEDIVMRVSDATNVLLGFKTDVFREARLQSRRVAREDLAFSIVSSSLGTSFDLECDTAEDRGYWANIFAWIINESRAGGVLNVLQRARKIIVKDTMNFTPETVEVADRNNLQVQIIP
jgi:hypothetical protein